MQPNIANPAAHILACSLGPIDDPAFKALRLEAFDASCEVVQLDQAAATIHAAVHANSMRFQLAVDHYHRVLALYCNSADGDVLVDQEASKLKASCSALDAERSRLRNLALAADDLLQRAIARQAAAEANVRSARREWIEQRARDDAKQAYHDEWKRKEEELAPKLEQAQKDARDAEQEMHLVADDGFLRAQAVAAFDRCGHRAMRLRVDHDVAVAGAQASEGGLDYSASLIGAEVNPRPDEPLML